MNPSWAHKTTTCKGCGESIFPGQRRLNWKFRKKEYTYIFRYHFDCGVAKMNSWYEDNPYQKPKAGRKSGSKLGLTVNETSERNKVLSKIRSHIVHYTERNPIMKHVEGYGSFIDPIRVKRFVAKYKELCAQLENLGGVPEKYKDYDAEALLEEIKQKYPNKERK